MAYKTCENCGSKVYGLGCVNCDEENYIAQQEMMNNEPEIYEGTDKVATS
jgi:hypothetical protein